MRVDLSVNYLGLKLKNPIIIGSSGLTSTVEKMKQLEQNNAGAVVVKSLFEEQLIAEAVSEADDFIYPEAFDYIKEYSQNFGIGRYLDLIEKATKNLSIPVIASIHCADDGDWIKFSKQIEQAGAKALEVNISILPTETDINASAYEKKYLRILEKIRKNVSIPIAVKLGYWGVNLAYLIRQIKNRKLADAVVLFNRFYNPDIDIEKLDLTVSNTLSNAEDFMPSLRWIAILSAKVDIPFVASTGVYTGFEVIKQLLAGATAVQMVSAIYKQGPGYINTVLDQIKDWMRKKEFSKLEEFRGMLNYKNVKNPEVFERVQFMKYYGTFE